MTLSEECSGPVPNGDIGANAKGGKRRRGKTVAFGDEKVETMQEILTRTNKNGCSVKKKETQREIGAGEGGAPRF